MRVVDFLCIALLHDSLLSRPYIAQAKLGGFQDPYLDEYGLGDLKSGAPTTMVVTRATFETLFRALVHESCLNVTFLAGTVTGLKRSTDLVHAVDGVVVRTKAEAIVLSAELVIGKPLFLSAHTHELSDLFCIPDATGPARGGSSKWLDAAGFPQDPQLVQTYHPNRKYSTAFLTVPLHLQAKAPIPWGFKPGPVFMLFPDASRDETIYLGSLVTDRDKCEH